MENVQTSYRGLIFHLLMTIRVGVTQAVVGNDQPVQDVVICSIDVRIG